MVEFEFGTSFPVRFLDPSQVKMYDGEGKEIEPPKCDKCNNFMQQIIGKYASTHICMECE